MMQLNTDLTGKIREYGKCDTFPLLFIFLLCPFIVYGQEVPQVAIIFTSSTGQSEGTDGMERNPANVGIAAGINFRF